MGYPIPDYSKPPYSSLSSSSSSSSSSSNSDREPPTPILPSLSPVRPLNLQTPPPQHIRRRPGGRFISRGGHIEHIPTSSPSTPAYNPTQEQEHPRRNLHVNFPDSTPSTIAGYANEPPSRFQRFQSIQRQEVNNRNNTNPGHTSHTTNYNPSAAALTMMQVARDAARQEVLIYDAALQLRLRGIQRNHERRLHDVEDTAWGLEDEVWELEDRICEVEDTVRGAEAKGGEGGGEVAGLDI